MVRDRDIYDVVIDYLKIIPDTEEVSEYRNALSLQRDKIKKRMFYASPEEFPIFWDNVNGVLEKYNNTFIEKGYHWAQAILYICIYDYNNKYVLPYLNILTHEYSKKN